MITTSSFSLSIRIPSFRNNINQELTDRKDVLEQIFKDGVKATSPLSEKSTLYTLTPS